MLALKDTLSLRELGHHFGVTPSAIMAAFKRNGISRSPTRSGPKASGLQMDFSQPQASAHLAVSRADHQVIESWYQGRFEPVFAYKVMLRHGPLFVMAPNLLDAVELANTATRCEILHVDLVGRAL